MSHTIQISDDLQQRIDQHLEDEETDEEFIEELVTLFETGGHLPPGRVLGVSETSPRTGADAPLPRPTGFGPLDRSSSGERATSSGRPGGSSGRRPPTRTRH